jgi:hypothetical protein
VKRLNYSTLWYLQPLKCGTKILNNFRYTTTCRQINTHTHNNIINKVSLKYSLPCNCYKQPVFFKQLRLKDNVVAVVSCKSGNATYYIRSQLVWEISAAEERYENITPHVSKDCIAITYYVLCDVCTIFIGTHNRPFWSWFSYLKRAWRTLTNVKVKLKVSLYTLWRHVGRVKIQMHSLLTLVLDGNDTSASRPGRFTSRYPLKGGGPEPDLTMTEEINILPIPEFKPRIVQTVANMAKMEQNKNLDSIVLFRVTLKLRTKLNSHVYLYRHKPHRR